MAYEWDKYKAKLNEEKHGVSFDKEKFKSLE